MTQTQPKISSLQPKILPDNRRVTFEMVVDHLPPMVNAFFAMPDMDESPPPPENQPGLYPNIELSILNSQRQQLATLYIIEHKEQFSALTLHIRTPDPHHSYIARAEMTYQDQIIDVIEIPFTLPSDM